MKAFRMYGVGDGRFGEVDEPELSPGEALIEVEAAGICGTDLHVLAEGVLTVPERLPVTMGHEFVGRVVEAGGGESAEPGLARLSVGDRVVAEPLLHCGNCERCARGYPNLCERWLHLGFTQDGAWAELVKVPMGRLTRVPDDVPAEHAVLAEPLACALHFLDRAGVTMGQSLLIVGGGPAGQLTLVAAKAMGIGPVMLSERSAARRRLAETLGADAVVDPMNEDVHAACLSLTRDAGVDTVIELAGNPAAVSEAFEIPRPGGTLLLAGICGERRIAVNTNRVVGDEITVRGAFATRWQMGSAVRLLSDGKLKLDPIVSLRSPWTDLPRAMARVSGEVDVCKVVLEF